MSLVIAELTKERLKEFYFGTSFSGDLCLIQLSTATSTASQICHLEGTCVH